MNQRECARLETQNGVTMLLQGIQVTGELRGLIFDARVEQRFCNPSDRNVEVVYTFPLPWGAVLLGVDVLLGGTRLTGAVVEKREAEARYEEALSEGDAAIMLERNRDHSYSLNLGNLAAHEDCVITLHYAQLLRFEQHGLRLLIPTVIAPRYGDAVAEGGLQPHQVPKSNLLAEYPFDIVLRVHGDLAQARVASPSHPVGVEHGDTSEGNVLTVSLARQGALDRDFVLVIDRLEQDSVAVLARDCVEPRGVVALASFCPRFPSQEPAPVAVKILVDCSGSMNGDSIEAARRSLQAIVQQLKKGDRFSCSRFGSTVEHRSRGLWTVTETTKLAAQRWVGDLRADLGGTEMESALVSTFALAQASTSDVLLVTDGEISAVDATIESARKSGHRLFVVGIGSSPAEAHLRRLAEATGGACDFVASGEAVEPAVLRMFARLRSPRLTDLGLVWPANTPPAWLSPLPASVFEGDTIHVFAWLEEEQAGEVRLVGKHRTGTTPEEIACARFAPGLEPGDALSRVAATTRVQSVETDWLVGALPEATKLALDYQLVTDRTNFLLVHARAEEDKPTEMPELHQVPQMLAAGWGGVGSVRTSRSVSFLECPAIDYSKSSLNWDDLDVHTSSVSFSESCVADHRVDSPGQDYLAIPAFLRKSVDASARMDLSEDDGFAGFYGKHAFDRANPRFWSDSEHYTGLSPLGLSEWLRVAPITGWPKSYRELRKIGLGVGVVDWLELTLASRGERPYSEQIVVGTFLYVMSRRETHEALSQSLGLGLLQSFRAVLQGTKSLFTITPASPLHVDVRLADEMVTLLDGMTADTWPDQIFALITPEQNPQAEQEPAIL